MKIPKILSLQVFLSLIMAVSSLLILGMSEKRTLNGFDLSRHSIPVDEIMPGGPPRDGIPALTDPEFLPADRVSFLKDDDRVLGIVIGDHSRAYPVKIMNWHEIVNDRIGNTPVVITYCPLCGTGIAFDPVIGKERLIFGVSGLLYNSDVLMYDRQSESLWSQIKQEAVTGKYLGTRLNMIFMLHTSWSEWRLQYPNTFVLSENTGFRRNYDVDPYKEYAVTPKAIFPVNERNNEIPQKEWVIGVEIEGKARAYPFSILKAKPPVFEDRLGSERILVHFEKGSRTAYITDLKGTRIPSIVGYWFAWYAFHPHTTIYGSDETFKE